MTPKQRAAYEEKRNQRFREAMASLIGNPSFGGFIDQIKQEREQAIEDACLDAVAANDRMSLIAMGEVRCYKAIISLYEEAIAAPPQEDSLPPEE